MVCRSVQLTGKEILTTLMSNINTAIELAHNAEFKSVKRIGIVYQFTRERVSYIYIPSPGKFANVGTMANPNSRLKPSPGWKKWFVRMHSKIINKMLK